LGWNRAAANGTRPSCVFSFLHSGVCRLPSAICRLPSAVCRLPSVRRPPRPPPSVALLARSVLEQWNGDAATPCNGSGSDSDSDVSVTQLSRVKRDGPRRGLVVRDLARQFWPTWCRVQKCNRARHGMHRPWIGHPFPTSNPSYAQRRPHGMPLAPLPLPLTQLPAFFFGFRSSFGVAGA
jgi:hypothetical protein